MLSLKTYTLTTNPCCGHLPLTFTLIRLKLIQPIVLPCITLIRSTLHPNTTRFIVGPFQLLTEVLHLFTHYSIHQLCQPSPFRIRNLSLQLCFNLSTHTLPLVNLTLRVASLTLVVLGTIFLTRRFRL